MRVRVRLFAMQRQQLGRREVPLELADGATVADAWAALAALHPVVAPARASVRFARNGAYADAGEPLVDGDEVAVIPPVAGGATADPQGPRVRHLAFTAGPIDAAALDALRAVVARDADGAVVEFLGRTRETPGTPAPGEEAEAARHVGQRVLGLDYEAFEPMALAVLGTIADEIEARFGVRRLAVLHRTGAVELGATSVAIVVAAPHRGPAFEACRYVIEELKARTPIWKAERFADGSVWLGAPARASAPDAAGGPAPERDA